MLSPFKNKTANRARRFRDLFATRDILMHDGRAYRWFSVAGRTQARLATFAAIALGFSAYGAAHAATDVIAIAAPAVDPQVSAMKAQVNRMAADLAATKQAAATRAARVEQRQAVIAAVLSGKGEPDKVAALVPAALAPATPAEHKVAGLFARVERRQAALAADARAATDRRYAAVAGELRRLGVRPERLVKGGMGGPFEPVPTSDAAASADQHADAQFRSLFVSWKKLDTLQEAAAIAVPSRQPVEKVAFTSSFGVRSDPFRGTAAMHAGVDIPGPVGTPVYATADGVVERSERAGGYGNLVELNHGKGIQTRYGHLSKLLVEPNTRVTRGQLIGLMGSTGRSTGSHLHYEVRIDGRAVNPMPFLQSGDALLARPHDISTASAQTAGISAGR